MWTKATGECLCLLLGSVWGADFRQVGVVLLEFGTTFGIVFIRRHNFTPFGVWVTVICFALGRLSR